MKVFSSINMFFLKKKNRKSKSRLNQKLCQFVFFSLWCHLWEAIKIRLNFLCNSLLHRNRLLLLSGQVLRQFSLKLVQNEKDYSLTTKISNFCKILTGRCETEPSLWRHFNKFFKAVSKQYMATKQQQKVLNFEPCYFCGENFYLP